MREDLDQSVTTGKNDVISLGVFNRINGYAFDFGQSIRSQLLSEKKMLLASIGMCDDVAVIAASNHVTSYSVTLGQHLESIPIGLDARIKQQLTIVNSLQLIQAYCGQRFFENLMERVGLLTIGLDSSTHADTLRMQPVFVVHDQAEAFLFR